MTKFFRFGLSHPIQKVMAPLKLRRGPAQASQVAERRKHLRFTYLAPLRIAALDPITGHHAKPGRFHAAKCKNLSQGGMKITTLPPFEPRSVAVLELDINLLKSMIDVKHLLTVSNRRILATVAWRHLNLETGLFEMGLQFIEDWRRDEYESYLGQAAEIQN